MTTDEKATFIGWCILEKKMTVRQIERLGTLARLRLMREFSKEKRRNLCKKSS